MATPEVRTDQIAKVRPTVRIRLMAGAGFSRLVDYAPRWWFLPLLGVAMLLALGAMLLGARYELYAIAIGGVALFGAVFMVLVFAVVLYICLLAKALAEGLRSKNAP